MEYEWACPKCGKVPGLATACYITGYAVQRIDIPYHMCGSCRTICFDRGAIKIMLRDWRNRQFKKDRIPVLRLIYKEVFAYLEEVITYYVKRVGYKRVKFIKKRKS